MRRRAHLHECPVDGGGPHGAARRDRVVPALAAAAAAAAAPSAAAPGASSAAAPAAATPSGARDAPRGAGAGRRVGDRAAEVHGARERGWAFFDGVDRVDGIRLNEIDGILLDAIARRLRRRWGRAADRSHSVRRAGGGVRAAGAGLAVGRGWLADVGLARASEAKAVDARLGRARAGG